MADSSRLIPQISKLFTKRTESKSMTASKSMAASKSMTASNNIKYTLQNAIKKVKKKLSKLTNNAKKIEAMEEAAATKIQKAVRNSIYKKRGREMLNKLIEERNIEQEKLKQERLKQYKQIYLVENALKELLIIQKNITEKITIKQNIIINNFNDILKNIGIVDNSSRSRSDRVSSSRSRSDRVSSSRSRSDRVSSISSNRETIVVMDRNKLMMNNLNIIFNFLSTIWSKYIMIDTKKNTIKIYVLGTTLGPKVVIPFLNIAELVKYFKSNYNKHLFGFATSKMTELLDKLNDSTDDKNSYDIIIQIMRQYIEENIDKPKERNNLINLQKVIDGLEKIRGGKLRKVRKTNVSKKKLLELLEKYKKNDFIF